MGNGGCLFKRKCTKQTGSSRNFCEEWTHVCGQCGSLETGTAERTGCQWDWSQDWSNMDWTEIYRGFYAGSVWDTEHLLNRDVIKIQYSDVTGQWNVKGKNADLGNALVNMTYGTSRRNAYQILEDSLNLKDSRVYDTVIEDGKERRVLNKKKQRLPHRSRMPWGSLPGLGIPWHGQA